MMPIPIPTCTTPAMDGCGWRHPGFGDGGLIPTLAFAVPTALAGTLAYTGPGMAGADTTAVPAGDTALVVARAVRAVITRSADLTAALVVARAVASVVIAASAAATAVDIADHDRQALAGVLIGYDRRGWHGQYRRHEVDRWNNGSRRQQWLWLNTALPKLYALPAIRNSISLTIVDARIAVISGDTSSPPNATPGRILLAQDPVALDSYALVLMSQLRTAAGMKPLVSSLPWIDNAAAAGLGSEKYSLIQVFISRTRRLCVLTSAGTRLDVAAFITMVDDTAGLNFLFVDDGSCDGCGSSSVRTEANRVRRPQLLAEGRGAALASRDGLIHLAYACTNEARRAGQPGRAQCRPSTLR